MTHQDEALRLLKPEKAVFLITVEDDGRPDARAMAVVKTEGLKTIWMITGKQSDKYRQLSRNSGCMLYATDMEDDQNYLELRMWGKIELLDDPESRQKAWLDAYLHYFPGGQNDPDMIVLRFTADSGRLQTQTGRETLTF